MCILQDRAQLMEITPPAAGFFFFFSPLQHSSGIVVSSVDCVILFRSCSDPAGSPPGWRSGVTARAMIVRDVQLCVCVCFFKAILQDLFGQIRIAGDKDSVRSSGRTGGEGGGRGGLLAKSDPAGSIPVNGDPDGGIFKVGFFPMAGGGGITTSSDPAGSM